MGIMLTYLQPEGKSPVKKATNREIISDLVTLICWIIFASIGVIGLSYFLAAKYFTSATSDQVLNGAKSVVELFAGIATMVAAFAAVGGLHTWKKSLVGSSIFKLRNGLRSAAFSYQAAIVKLVNTPKSLRYSPLNPRKTSLTSDEMASLTDHFFSEFLSEVEITQKALWVKIASGAISRKQRTILMKRTRELVQQANIAEYYARLIIDAHSDYGVLEEEKPLLDKSIAILFGSGDDSEKREFLKKLDEEFSNYEEFIDEGIR